jgi:hypothetical protein
MKKDSDEYRKLMEERKAAGRLIDPATAKLSWWFVKTLDEYGDGLEMEEYNMCRGYFVRAPDRDIWVEIGDLPQETRREGDFLRPQTLLDPFVEGQVSISFLGR